MSLNVDMTGDSITTDSVTVSSSTNTGTDVVKAVAVGSSTGPTITSGSGAPSATAPQGSIYLRTDGSSTSTRLYVNTTGSTTWTNVTTAA